MHFQAQKRNPERDKTQGTVMVELAVMLPFLAILLLGVMEISVVVHNKSVITNASVITQKRMRESPEAMTQPVP